MLTLLIGYLVLYETSNGSAAASGMIIHILKLNILKSFYSHAFTLNRHESMVQIRSEP